MPEANSRQVGGAHYQAPYQHWDLVADAGLGYFDGQATKYVSRWRKKNGIQDLQKAQHFLQKYAEVFQMAYRPRASRPDLLGRFLTANNLDWKSSEGYIITLLTFPHGESSLLLARQVLDTLVQEESAGASPAYVKQGD